MKTKIAMVCWAALALAACKSDNAAADGSASANGAGATETAPAAAAQPPIVNPYNTGSGSGDGKTCMTATLIDFSRQATIISDNLQTATNTSQERISMTSSSWRGPEMYYAIEGRAGEQLMAYIHNRGFDSGMYLITNCDAIPASVIAGVDSNDARGIEMTLPTDGRYILVVDSGHNIPNLAETDYHLAISKRPAREGNEVGLGRDACAAATESITLPFQDISNIKHFTATFDETAPLIGQRFGGPEVFYRYDAPGPQTLRISVRDFEGGQNGTDGFDSGVYVFTDCNNIGGTAVGGADTDLETPAIVTLPSAGTYYIALDSWARTEVGVFGIQVEVAN